MPNLKDILRVFTYPTGESTPRVNANKDRELANLRAATATSVINGRRNLSKPRS